MLLFASIRERTRFALFGENEKHVAVLPFDNIGNNPENQALGEGLMDSLAGKLSNLDVGNKSLWVVPTTKFGGAKSPIPPLRSRNSVPRSWSKGSVQRNGKDVHLNVSLIDTKNLRQLGSAELEDPAGTWQLCKMKLSHGSRR